jgi:hypothetical protein
VKSDWNRYCQAKDIKIEEDEAHGTLTAGRTHHVAVVEQEDGYMLRSLVVRAADVNSTPDAAVKAWLRNRFTELVSFRIDNKGRMVGEAWAPKKGLTPEEFGTLVRAIASESDRFEYVLTGADRE